MNKSGLKKFATNIRIELLSLVKTKVDYFLKLDISNLPIEYKKDESSIKEIINRCMTDNKLDKTKYEDFVEEVSYIWFNRLVALRFMDVNDITEVKVISPLEGHTIPAIFTEAKSGNISDDLDIDRTHFYNLLDKKVESKDSDNECFRILFIATCNYYSSVMPFMFESIADYTELLLPDDLLSSNSIRTKVIEGMEEEDCSDIEVIGWLYQFYISEKKDDVFEKLKKNVKITPSNIPAATQLFTPHWIVKYMVENSLGKLWMLNHPNSSLKDSMKYYIEEENPTDSFLKISKPEELSLIDPCCGSGHILTYAFDLLTLIYEEQGYSKSEIPTLILENNIYGCDIDKRAATLANFALTMKARLYHRRFFKKSTTPNVIELIEYGNSYKGIKNFGSLLTPKEDDLNIQEDGLLGQVSKEFKLQTQILSSLYSCVITNPPYMGGKGMNKELTDFVKDRYPDSKSDLFAVFMERTLELTKKNGFMSMINQHSWMFLSSYEKLRTKIIENQTIDTMIHLGARAFEEIGGEVVQSVSFVLENDIDKQRTASYIRLTDYKSSDSKEEGFFDSKNLYTAKQSDFEKIPGSPIAYWVSDRVQNIFENSKKLGEISEPKQGLATGNNDLFMRNWAEVSFDNIGFQYVDRDSALDSNLKWFPYNKGGEFQKWYGNQDYLVNWENDGVEIQNFFDEKGKLRSRPQNKDYYFRDSISWTLLSSSYFAIRTFPKGFIFDVNGMSLFIDKDYFKYIASFLSTKLAFYFLKIINPTLAFQVGNIKALPIIFNKQEATKQQIDTLTQECIDISKEDWDSRETSWDFSKNELLKHKSDSKLETAYNNYCSYWKEKFYKLHSNEEELNRLFIDIYELQDEITPDVDLNDITILKQETNISDSGELEFDSSEIMKQFISYTVGVMFGRYSLDSDGLVVANLNQELPKDSSYEIDDDNVIPVLEDDYFSDDISSRIINFVKTTFGTESLSANINFIEKCLGKTIRNYMVKDFYEDHIKRYKKRPIYWMVSSPKKGFMSLSYMHRYESDMFARVQNNYLREYITKLEGTVEVQKQTILNESSSNKDKKDADKQIKTIEAKLKEIMSFDRDTLTSFAQNRIEIDLDDGVKVNYIKFKEILYPIKGLDKE